MTKMMQIRYNKGMEKQTASPFGRWLKRLRAEQDLTQEMLAEKIDCATPTLRAFEIGKRRPSREMAERIADVLQIPTDQRAEFLRLARATVTEPVLPITAPTPSSAVQPATPSPLPKPLNALIGREAELQALAHLLHQPHIRLVTIVGPGGMGKTRLAQQSALDQQTAFRAGAIYVPLTAVVAGPDLLIAVANALGITQQPAVPLAEQLLQYLAECELLLVLDNFEQLLGPAAGDEAALRFIQQILQRASGVRLLITSRERLRIQQEHVFELAGLATPQDPSTFEQTSAIEQADAVLLFLKEAQQATGDFALSPENRTDVARICHLLDGMPLAIELAAAWVRVLSCTEIAAEIQRDIDFLALADRDMAPRHRSMRVVFDHSWALLTKAEQQVLLKLAVFRGGCHREAVQAVAGATLPLLATLMDKSLLRKIQNGAHTRYEMHELLRQYAAHHLDSYAGLRQQIEDAHRDFYAHFVQAQQAKLSGPQQTTALTAIEQELANIRAAWLRAAEQADGQSLLKMVHGLGEALYWRSHYHEGYTLLQAAADRLAPQVTAAATPALQLAFCAVRAWLGCFMILMGKTNTVEALFEQTLAQLDQLAPADPAVRFCQALTLGEYAYFYLWLSGDYRHAYELQAQSIALYRALGESHQLVRILTRQSGAIHYLGRYTEALTLAREAIELGQANDDQLVIVSAIESLARSLTYIGRLHEAIPYLYKALAAAEATQQPGRIASVLLNLGVVLTFAGQFMEGQAAWQRGYATSVTIGDQVCAAHTAILLGFSDLHLGAYAAAAQQAQASFSRADEIGYVRGMALSQLLLGSAALALGQFVAAQQALTQSIAHYRTIPHPDELGWALAIQSYVLYGQGQPQAAQLCAVEAITWVEKANSFVARYSLLPIVARLLFDQGQIELAHQFYTIAWQSDFVRLSPWFDQVVGAARQAALASPGPALAAVRETANATDEPSQTITLLKRAAMLLPVATRPPA